MASVEDTSVEQSVEATRRMVQEMRSVQKLEKLVEPSQSHTAASINGNGQGAASDMLAAGWPQHIVWSGDHICERHVWQAATKLGSPVSILNHGADQVCVEGGWFDAHPT